MVKENTKVNFTVIENFDLILHVIELDEYNYVYHEYSYGNTTFKAYKSV